MVPMEFLDLELPLDQNVQATLESKAKEGWSLFPYILPKGRWILMRPVQAQPQSLVNPVALGTLGIDDSKVGILRNGKFVDNDGNEVPPPF